LNATDDLAAPLGRAQINMLGRYAFPKPTAAALRALRDPDAPEEADA